MWMTLHFCTRVPSAETKSVTLFVTCKTGVFEKHSAGNATRRFIYSSSPNAAPCKRALAHSRTRAYSRRSFFVPFSTLQYSASLKRRLPTRLISINANIRDAKRLHLNITVCAAMGRCHCCQKLGVCMYTHEKQHRAHISPNLVRTYVLGFTLIDPALLQRGNW